MTLQLSPAEVAFYRSVRKTAVILLLMMKLDSPTPAKRIAEILDLDYATTRRHLKTLSNLGVLTETFSGWSLLQGGIQLLLPERSYPSSFRTHPQAVDNVGNSRAVEMQESCQSAGNSRAIEDSSSTSTHQPSVLPIEEEEEEMQESCQSAGKPRSAPGLINACLQALADNGIADSAHIRGLVETKDYITPAYIIAQARRLKAEDKFSTGMLITVLRCGDPLPKQEQPDEDNADARREYFEGKWSHLVKR